MQFLKNDRKALARQAGLPNGLGLGVAGWLAWGWGGAGLAKMCPARFARPKGLGGHRRAATVSAE